MTNLGNTFSFAEAPILRTEQQTAEVLGRSIISMYRLRKAGKISYRRCGGRVMYHSIDIIEFLEKAKCPATGTATA